ncbi:hypothetical protein [Phytohabitans kaempferiae]|uniref:Uncharacterized protein n=1 Tax=Phytohabitans kaempferiae TaxID=1620943 RepID=A0ABV6MEM2_9ACTN
MRWLEFPVGRDAAPWRTVATERTVLAAVHTMASAGHVLDAVELLEQDSRIQVVFTHAPDLFSGGVREHLRAAGAVEIPWEQAVHTAFDLVVAADSAGVHRLRGPWLAIAHGVMNNKLAPPALGGPATELVTGLGSPWLTWYGRLLPAVLAVSHREVLPVLAHQCPQALPVAAVVGDLCLDRLSQSRPHQAAYRRALGVDDGRRLVAISSTWGPRSLLGRSPTALFDLIADLPADGFAVAMAIHPAAWHGHGRRQMLAWLASQRRAGLRLVDPASWRGLVAAADVVIGDHGSATIYAAAAGVPVLRAGPLPPDTAPGSPAQALATIAPAVRPDRPLAAQLREAVGGFDPSRYATVAAGVTSQPGQAGRLLREQMYRLLRLPGPAAGCAVAPVGPAVLVGEEGGRR